MRLSSTCSKQYCAFLFLIVFDNVPNVISQVIYVNRIAGEWKPDKFGSASTPTMCNTFNGANDVGASECACPSGINNTFLYKPNLTCVSNAEINNILEVPTDCNNDLLHFLNQGFKTPFVVFDLTTSTINPNAKFDNFVKKFEGMCEVQQQAFYINDLSGKIISTFGGKAFTINKTSKQLQWNLNAKLQDTLRGRIVRLKLTDCKVKYRWVSPPLTVHNPCIVFKVQGTVNFPTLTSSTTSITKKPATITAHSVSSSPSTIVVKPTSTFTTTSVHPSKSSSVELVTSTLHRISIHPSSIQTPIISTLSSGTLTPTSTIHGRSATTVVPIKPTDTAGHRKNERKDSSPIAAIVGALVAVIGVVIVVVLLVVWRRRKRNQNEEKEKDTNKSNPTYGRGETIHLSNQHNLRNTDNDFEYDYAAVDGDPRCSSNAAPGIYQSLTKDPNRESVYTPSDRQQDIPSDQSTGYDKVERPIFKPARKGPTDPLYNVLGRPNEGQLQPGTHDKPTGQSTGYDKVEHPVFQPPRKGPTDPLYNVLERPNGTNHDYMEPGVNIDKNNKAPQNNEPVYNVLEGPGEDPDYNVLEDPNEQYEPEYNVLEDPGDNPDNVPVDGHDNVGYASTIDIKSRGAPIYAAPEGPISEPTYQPLTISGPDESVYQPLDRKSRVVPDDQPLYHVLESTTSDA